MSQVSASGVTKREGSITIDEIRPHLSNPNKEVAQLRQIIETEYPAARGGNSMQAGLFSSEEFGGNGQTFQENRVAFVDIPRGTTMQQVAARLAGLREARLYRVLSLKPILTDEQKRAMETGLSKTPEGHPITIEHYKETQRVVDSEGNPVDYKGVPQYRRIFFDPQGKADIDTREAEFQVAYGETFTMNQPVSQVAQAVTR